MAQVILTPTAVTREALRILHNNLVFSKKIDRQYDASFANTGAKIGQTLKVRKPNQFTVRTGAGLDAQDISETSETITVADQIGVDTNFTTAELTMDLDDFSDRILTPAMARLAAEVDKGVAELSKDVYNTVGTLGTTPTTLDTYLNARQYMLESLTPVDSEWCIAHNAAAEREIVDALKGLFQSSERIKAQYEEGAMGVAIGNTWYQTENVTAFTAGTQDNTTPLTNGASQTGSAVIISGFDASATITKGTTFTLAGSNQVNAETKVNQGRLQQFVCTADTTADGAGAITIPISPSITTSGATQTVTASPTHAGAMVILGSQISSGVGVNNLMFHKEFGTLVTADLEMPKGVDFAARQVMDGISMRIIRQYDINSDKMPCRIDILKGEKTLRPEFACKILG